MYYILKTIVNIFCKIVFFVKIEGKENIPKEGAAIIAANHTSNWDAPVIFSLTSRRIRIMSKAELFKNKLFAAFLYMVGAFPVRRGQSDIKAVKTALHALKDGEIFAIFPTGTRVKGELDADAKAGVALIASRSSAPVIPVTIRGGYKPFKRVTVYVGKPLYVKNENGTKPSNGELKIYADAILAKINSQGVE